MPEVEPVTSPPSTRRLAAVWFADIVGYSRLSSEDQPAALWLVRVLQSTARDAIAVWGGRLVKRIGDAVLAEFSSTSLAVHAAVLLEQNFKRHTELAGAPALLRVGVHVGDVAVDEDGDIYGDGVNLASRLQMAAEPGTVLASEDVRRQLRGLSEFCFVDLGERTLGSECIPVRLYGVTVRDGAPRSLPPREGPGAISDILSAEPVTESRSPYVGLRAYSEADAPYYFGREVFARQLFDRVHRQKVVAVVAASGTGKSSLVQAGLVPLLRREASSEGCWDVITFSPGARPFHAIAAALVDQWTSGGTITDRVSEAERLGNALAEGLVPMRSAIAAAVHRISEHHIDRLLLIVDQFEELFAQTRQPPVRKRFMEQLIAAVDELPVCLLVTLRADFYGHAIALSRDFSDRLQSGLVNLGSMTAEELTRAIVRPAASASVQFEPGLVDRILDDVHQQPGGLPLLEFALLEIWSRRTGTMLTHAAYEAIGRVEGAIALRADRELGARSSEEQERLLRALTRMVHIAAPQEEGSDTRLRQPMSSLEIEVHPLVHAFVEARLLVANRDVATGEETVEVAHEALINNWPRLRRLLDEHRAFLLWRQRLDIKVREWKQMGSSNELLLKGPLLAEARGWSRRRGHDLNVHEREFLKVSGRAAVSRKKLGVALTTVIALCAVTTGGVWAYSRGGNYQIMRILTTAEDIVPGAEDTTAATWYTAVLETGRREKALAGAASIDDAVRRTRILAGIVQQLLSTGRASEAAQVREEAVRSAAAAAAAARARESPERRSEDFQQILTPLVEAGEVRFTAALAQEALAAAQAIEMPEQRKYAISRVAPILAKVGLLPLARSAVESTGDPVIEQDLLISLASHLARAGNIRDARAVIEGVDPARRDIALEIAFENLQSVDPGLIGHAGAQQVISALQTMKSPGREYLLSSIAEQLIRAGAVDEVLSMAREIRDSDMRQLVLLDVTPSLAAAGYSVEAHQILRSVTSLERVRALASVTLELARQGATEDALRLTPVIREAVRAEQDPVDTAWLLVTLAEIFHAAGREADATAMTLIADSVAQGLRYDHQRSRASREVAKRYAALGLLRTARLVADRRHVSDNDRLHAYTVILRQHRVRSTPYRNDSGAEASGDL